MQKKIANDLSKLRFLMSRRDKFILLWLLLATILFSVIETLGISVIMPFITFASNPAQILSSQFSKHIYDFLNFSSTLNFMIFFSVVLIGFYIFRAVYSIVYIYLLNRFAFRKAHYFAYQLFGKMVETNYFNFTKKNADRIRATIMSESLNVSTYISNLLQMFAEFFTIILLYGLLLIVSWKMTLVLTLIMALQIFLIIKNLSKKIKDEGYKHVVTGAKLEKIITQTFGNFKFIKLKGNQREIHKGFGKISDARANLLVFFNTLNALPKNLLETIAFILLITCVVYILIRYNDASAVIPIISMYALALYRILPSVNRILNNYNVMNFYKKSLSNVYEDLVSQTIDEGNLTCEFKKTIELKNINFSYIDSKPIIKDFNMVIHKGDKIAFFGISGAGKSTLVDIIIGIYQPKSGEILVDGVLIDHSNLASWRKKIGYIPQNIYLFDGSVAENVAFGSEIDDERVILACKKANIWEFLLERDGVKTLVGEGGVRLSGGQIQRIGIARAIYDDPEILVLDEATSALDKETESKIMDEIYDVAKNKTLLVIAHRLQTIERCERKVKLEVAYSDKKS